MNRDSNPGLPIVELAGNHSTTCQGITFLKGIYVSPMIILPQSVASTSGDEAEVTCNVTQTLYIHRVGV